MIVRFSLPYRTLFGQRLAVCGSHPLLGHWQPAAAVDLNYDEATGCWSLEVELPDTAAELTYKYVLHDDHTGAQHW
ncbi:MAG: CBM20 domain-containing protein, partial [Bacteroidota bacterium]|nr:CBM20 domain-containing protein [Bacteroidota bacterium]